MAQFPAYIIDTPQTKSQLPFYIDSTMLSSYKNCPKKFYYQYVQRLRPRGFNVHLSAGGAYAAALEMVRNLQARHSEPLEHDTLFQAGLGAYLAKWDGPNDLEDHTKNPHNMLNMLEHYLKEYHPYYDEVQPLRSSLGKPTTEFSFSIPLPIDHPDGGQFVYVGRFDLLGKYTTNDQLVVLDDKTTSSLGGSWLKQWDLRGQFIGYVWACRKMGYDVQHAMVRGSCPLTSEIKFLSVPLLYPDHLLDRWEYQLYQSITSMMQCEANNYWPYDFADSCNNYGGCPMKDLCLAKNPEDWFTNFEENDWNPLNQDDSAGY